MKHRGDSFEGRGRGWEHKWRERRQARQTEQGTRQDESKRLSWQLHHGSESSCLGFLGEAAYYNGRKRWRNERFITCLASLLPPPHSKVAAKRIKQQHDSYHHRDHYCQVGPPSPCTWFSGQTQLDAWQWEFKQKRWKHGYFLKIKTDKDRLGHPLNCLYWLKARRGEKYEWVPWQPLLSQSKY